MRILLVEDDESVAKILQKVLTDEHYAVDVATDGRSGWQLASGTHYDLVILDVVLPELDGLEFCRQLRDENYSMPVLFVTALNASSKKVAGLNAGADDYITKPFELEELLARVRALLRRVNTAVALSLQWGALQLEVNSREVTYQDQTLLLTPKEYAILKLFLRNPTQAFSRQAILDNLWSYSDSPGEETVTSHIKLLRRKLRKAGAPADFIETVYWVFYRLKPSACEDRLSEECLSEKRLLKRDRSNGLASDSLLSNSLSSDSSVSDSECVADPTLVKRRQQQTQTALATLWKSVKPQQAARLVTLQQAIKQLQTGDLSADLRRAAYRSAHSLTGVLGIFGSKKGSHTADQIQTVLLGDAAISKLDRRRLRELVEKLNTSINEAIEHHQNIAAETVKMPLLVLVDPQLKMMSTLVSTLWTKGFIVKRAQEIATLSAMLTAMDSATNRVTGNHIDAMPDIVMLNFSFDHAGAKSLNMLSTLAAKLPSLMMLICSADGSLSSRVKASQLGDYPFFCQSDAVSVVKTIELLRSHPPAKSQKILAVDDDPQMLQGLQTRLEQEDYQIVTLNKPVEFWQTLQTESPDLLLLDISMPDFTGIELCLTVRQAPAWSHLPIVFFTSHTDAHTQQIALRAGADNLLEKSTPDSQLFSHLNSQIKRSHLQKVIQQANAAIVQGSALPAL